MKAFFLACLVFVIAFSSGADGLQCYFCSKPLQDWCADSDQLDAHASDAVSSKMDCPGVNRCFYSSDKDNTLVVRGCGVSNMDGCESAGDLTACNCDTDLCNSARKPVLNLMVVFIFVIFGTLLF